VVASCRRIKCDCTFDGKRLWGRVRWVGAGEVPHARVREITIGTPDLRVQRVAFGLATSCGKWYESDTFGLEDLKVRKVDFGEDFSIRYDPSFPGIP
jgi:hypothetical protein